MDLNEKTYTATLIASINKTYNQSRLDGKLHIEDLYILNAVYKLLTNCETALTSVHVKILNSLYTNIINSSKYLCTSKQYSSFAYISQKPFIQAETEDCNSLPIQDVIYYWQESLGTTYQNILDLISTGSYIETKPFDTREEFVKGVDIDYIDIGLIAFAIPNSTEDMIYDLYDILENNVTEGFLSYFNTDLKTRIFIGINIYSMGVINFKIKQT